ncbi:hypothetical protein JCM8547_009186 [Rhodosporidiobolus lusitaniae]
MSSVNSLTHSAKEGTSTRVEPLLDEVEHKKLIRRIDLHMLPWGYLTYCVMRIDVGNISNAGVMNSEAGHSLKQVLGLSAQQWAWCLASFYYTYMFLEPASVYFLKLTSPSKWISRIMISWGIVMACQAAVSSYGGLISTRILIGAFEAGYFPCIVFHWAFWYTPFELAPRLLGLYMAGAAASAASGFLSWAISYADGVPMYGWRWLFIIEGILPILLGIANLWILPDFPSDSNWLSACEIEHLVLHKHKDAPKETGKTFDMKESLAILRDPTYFVFTLIWILTAVGGHATNVVLPQIVKDMHFTSSATTNLLQIPPAASIILFLFICSEFVRRRLINPFPLIMLMQLLILVGYVILQVHDTAPGVRYFAVCLAQAAAGVTYPVLWPKRLESLRGTAGAALGIGLHNAAAQFSGLVGPQLYRSDYAPRYYKSFLAASVMIAAVFLLLAPLWWLVDGDLSKQPRWLRRKVQGQNHYREGDEERDARKEAFRVGDARREEGGEEEKA